MDPKFWHKKWQTKEIGFHQAEANPLLVKYFKELALQEGSRIFLPLCGKTIDIAWLLSKGCRVAGAELSEIAVEELFDELGIKPEVAEAAKLKRYSGKDIDIFVGDIFNLSAGTLGPVDAIYDRAALVALPVEMRRQYASHLMRITNRASQFVICFEYDQQLMEGPPFAVDVKEVELLYSDAYKLSCLERAEVAGGLKGICAALETVWLCLAVNK